MNKRLAFTLIELLVVIAVIGILSGLIVVSMSGTTQKATIAKSQIFSNSLRNSLMLDLISEWRLDEVIGSSAPYTTLDAWNGGNTGTLTNFSFDSTDGLRNNCVSSNCLQFDGSNDFVNCGKPTNLSPGLGNFTIEVWFKTGKTSTGAAQNNVLIGSKSTSYSYRPGYHISADYNLYFVIGDGTNYASRSSTAIINDNKWHLVVVTFNRKSVGSIYIDGVFDSSQPIDSVESIVPGYDTTIGGGAGGTYHNYTGLIDTVRYYKEVVSTSQIKEQYFIGLNSLLIGGNISEKEYLSRINEYAIK